jgi:NAD(P) transhydrogenase subunit alpha
MERGAGTLASFSDEEYGGAGATIVETAAALYKRSEVVLKVQPPHLQEAKLFREGATYLGFLAPLDNLEVVQTFLKRRVTGFSMEYVPRITRAQSMDALSSMATIAGYKAVLIAAEKLGKMFPLMMTAAGTVPPAVVLVLGAGVAGLQAIATAKRLGARVEAFDPRPAVKEQVKSLGATFIEMELPEDVETKGGYAKELSAEFLKKEQDTIAARLARVDIVITTAQVFGKRAPLLITAEMVKMLHRGSVIVDLAAEQGGNCELTKPGKTTERNGVSIIGAVNLPATVPVHASQMYARNIVNLVLNLFPQGVTSPAFEDEITRGSCITREGKLMNESVQAAIEQQAHRKTPGRGS